MGTPAAGHSQKGLGRVRRSMPGVGARRFASVWHARGGFRQRSPTRALAAERTGAQLATRPLPMKHKGRGRRSRRAHSNSWGEQAVVEDAITPDWALAQPAAVEVRTQSPSSPAPLRAWLSIGIGAASLLGAAGALESVLSIKALLTGILPPTINLDQPIAEAQGFNLVAHSAQEKGLRAVMNNSFGFGGTNATVIFSKI